MSTSVFIRTITIDLLLGNKNIYLDRFDDFWDTLPYVEIINTHISRPSGISLYEIVNNHSGKVKSYITFVDNDNNEFIRFKFNINCYINAPSKDYWNFLDLLIDSKLNEAKATHIIPAPL